jgi:hypothetical protein
MLLPLLILPMLELVWIEHKKMVLTAVSNETNIGSQGEMESTVDYNPMVQQTGMLHPPGVGNVAFWDCVAGIVRITVPPQHC